MAWAACGKHRPATAATFRVRSSMRPWPWSRVRSMTGICRHPNPASWAYRVGWLALTTSRESAPRSTRKLVWSRWVCMASAVTTTPARSRPASSGWNSAISLVAAGTSRWASTAPSWWSRAASRRTWWPSRVELRSVLPSTATTRRRRRPGGRSRSASHAPTARSNRSPSTRASTRRMVASPGTWQWRVSGSRRTPSAARTGPGASVAHSAIAVTDRAPAATAAALTASTLARVCRRPRRPRGSGSSPAAPAGQGTRPGQVGGHGRGRQRRRGWGMIRRQARVSVRS